MMTDNITTAQEYVDYESREGFWRDSAEVLWQFRQLVRIRTKALFITFSTS
jgi:hypothetical protein